MKSDVSFCKNCGGTEWFAKEVDANGGYGPHLLPLGFFSGATFLIRVCGGCGHVEWFVPPRHLPKVKARFAADAAASSAQEPGVFPESDQERPADLQSDVAGTPWEHDPGHTND